MSGFDRNQVYVVPVHAANPIGNGEKPSDTLEALKQFLMDFRVGHAFIYRDQLRSNLLLKLFQLEVDLADVSLYNQRLADAIQRKPGETMPLFETAATHAARSILFPLARADIAAAANGEVAADGIDHRSEALKRAEDEVPGVQVSIRAGMHKMAFRDLTVDTTILC